MDYHHFADSTAERTLNHLRAGEVERFHAVPEIPSQTVGAHTYGVLVLAFEIGGELDGSSLRYMLYHDAPEIYTGDMPFSVKRDFPQLRKELEKVEDEVQDLSLNRVARVDDRTKLILKFADLLEGYRYALLYERGNKHVAARWAEALRKMFIQHCSDNSRLEHADKVRAYDLFVRINGGAHPPCYSTFQAFKQAYHRE